MSNDSRRSGEGGSISVPTELGPVGGSFNGSRARERSQYSSYFSSLSEGRQLDIALMSGDAGILAAWSSCMQSRGGGLAVRFGVADGRYVRALIEYFPQGAKAEIRITDTPYLPPGVRVLGSNCVEIGSVIKHDEPCRLLLQLSNDHIVVPLIVNGDGSTAEAWLPRRLRLQYEVRSFTFSPEDAIGREYLRVVTNEKKSVRLSNESIAEGWYFDRSTAAAPLFISYARRAQCAALPVEVEDYTFTYGLHADAPRRSPDSSSGVAWCGVTPRIMIRREVWVGINGDVSPATVSSDTREAETL